MNCTLSTDKKQLDLAAIHNYISESAYWGHGRSMEEVITTVENSFCFGLYDKDGVQIAFARVLTDFVAFAYLMDVIVFEPFRGKGYGRQLLSAVMEHKALSGIKTFALKTRDAHNFYKEYGFKELGNPELWMAKEQHD